jgi:hypothetical protein
MPDQNIFGLKKHVKDLEFFISGSGISTKVSHFSLMKTFFPPNWLKNEVPLSPFCFLNWSRNVKT